MKEAFHVEEMRESDVCLWLQNEKELKAQSAEARYCSADKKGWASAEGESTPKTAPHRVPGAVPPPPPRWLIFYSLTRIDVVPLGFLMFLLCIL